MKRIFYAIIFNLCLVNLSFSDEPTIAPEGKRLLSVLTSDYVLGDKAAKVTIIEYSSLTCPHCSYFHQEVFEKFKEIYIDTGKIKYVHRDFPLDKVAFKGSVLAHCSGEKLYYKFLKVLFNKQSNWAYQKNFLEILENIGKLGGISGEKFQTCMNDKNLENQILNTQMQATKLLEINSTPTFFVNGVRHRGALSLEEVATLYGKSVEIFNN
jgi:protein-disulfide isomerase